jgi:hypothetical protein
MTDKESNAAGPVNGRIELYAMREVAMDQVSGSDAV